MLMEKLLVAVIDIGDIFSRCAISSPEDFLKNPTKVLFLSFESPLHYPSYQLPTTILLNKEKEFEAFGYEAESKYDDLLENSSHKNWYYFKRFRLQLRRSNMNVGSSTVKTIDGQKELSIVFIFSLVIRYFRTHVINYISKVTDLLDDDIYWVIPVPDEWSGHYETLFIESCHNGGLKCGNFTVVPESKANLTFCEYNIGPSPGLSYPVVDCGIRHLFPDVLLENQVTESIGIWDGTPVDSSLRKLFVEITGEDILLDSRLQREDRVNLYKKIQNKVNNIRHVSFKIPLAWRNEIVRRLKHSRYKNKIKLLGDKLRLSDAFVFEIFQAALQPFLQNVSKFFEKNKVKCIQTFLQVGAFSENPRVTELIETALKDYDYMLDPNIRDTETSVIKGSAIIGHVPVLLNSSAYRFRLCMYKLESPPTTREMNVRSDDNLKKDVCKLSKDASDAQISILSGRKRYSTNPVKSKDMPCDSAVSGTNSIPNVFLMEDPKTQIHFSTQSDIVEIFCEIYETEWIDCLEALLEQGFNEVKCIDILLTILTEGYEECLSYTRMQLRQIAKTFNPTLTENELQNISDADSSGLPAEFLESVRSWRQIHDNEYSLTICNRVTKSLASKFKLQSEQIALCKKYTKTSVANCLRMICTEPPMYMDWDFCKCKDIDPLLLQFYTKSGRNVDFVVWPVIYSNRGGRVLSKGVVQAK